MLDLLVFAAAAAAVPSVSAVAETQPVTSLDDAADDPAIWRNSRAPGKSLIVATDKRGGLHLYDLDGRDLHFAPSPRLNNVDLRDKVRLGGKPVILVAASDRRDEANARMAVFALDPAKPSLVPLASIAVGPGEAYGMCLWRRRADKALFGFVIMKDGRIDQLAFDLSGDVPAAQVVRRVQLATQAEGCVADDRTGLLYVAEEDAGLWRLEADPSSASPPVSLARTDATTLVADAEGLALSPKGRSGGMLLASSQGDNAYALYSLKDARFLSRFRIGGGAIDGVSETDGLELDTRSFGKRFPKGLLVVQDGDNAPDAQNFKLVSWGDVMRLIRQK